LYQGGSKIERARDLFEQACEHAPAENARILYLMYAELEERFGLARHAMHVYDKACRAVSGDEKPRLFNIYIAKATEFFGVTRTREIFDRAVESLPDKHAKVFCLRYAKLERKLGEIDRARTIYTYASQFCDPSPKVRIFSCILSYQC
jgi:pre-mRNA-splicing factor SYF1